MKALTIFIIFILTPLVSISASDQKSVQKLEGIIKKSGIPRDNLGLWIGTNLSNPIFELNSQIQFVPASTSKILTAVNTLKSIPIDHKFKTELYYKGKLKNGKLTGDLYLKGEGDPSFISESMWSLVNEFMRAGISEIDGSIVIDDYYFDQERFTDSRDSTRVDRAYDAPVGAMSFNWNSINVFIRPGQKIGDPVKVFADPESTYIKVINRARTVKGKTKNLRVQRIEDPNRQGDTLIVSGGLGILRDEVVVYKSILQPDYWSGHHLREFLSRRGVNVSNKKIQKGKVPSDALLVADQDSTDLREIVADMMKFSNNYVAEMLTKNVSALIEDVPGNIQTGVNHGKEILESTYGWQSKNYAFINPSGLTRENKFRAVDLASLLIQVKDDFQIFPEFLASLPIAGRDGTLKDRMVGTPAEGNVRAKTGMLNGVLGLAGYAGGLGRESITFAFFYNGSQTNINKALTLIDNLAVAVAEIQ